MIRIDEIYQNLFWPYVQKNIRNTRLYYCDPPGSTSPDNLFNFGNDSPEDCFVFLHDSEPVHPDIHWPLFTRVEQENIGLHEGSGPLRTAFIHSEWRSEFVNEICKFYNWTPYYYFFHGWAALDWYRGYNKSFLIADPEDRQIQKAYISPNRIVGGKRLHRLLLLYMTARHGVKNSFVSFPKTCPEETVDVIELARKHFPEYTDMPAVLESLELPWNFPYEEGHPMHSCWLSLFDLCAQSAVHVVTETVADGVRNHLTEKTFKPICLQMPFVLLSTAGSLEYLKRYGFRTFNTVWDESYDAELDDSRRLRKVARLITDIDTMSPRELQQLYRHTVPIVKHNYTHFYGGDFESILWRELTNMLSRIKKDFQL